MIIKKNKSDQSKRFKEIISLISDNVLKEIARCIIWKTGDHLIIDFPLYRKPEGISNKEYNEIIYNELERRNIDPWVK